MKTKNILALALLPMLGMLTACSADDEQTTEGRVPIILTASTLTVTETRAAAGTALNNGYLEAEQAVKVCVRPTGSTSAWAEYIYTSGASGVLNPPTTPPFYPLDGSHVDIAAFSPSSAGETFTIHSDQTSQEGFLASDLVFASVTNQEKSTTAVPLQFEHKMAKVVVDVQAGAGVSTIEEVTLHKVLPSVAFNQATGVVSSATGTETTVTLVKGNETSKIAGAAAIPAQAIDGELLTIKTNIGTATYSVNSKVFTAGRVYRLNIGVTRAAVNTTTEITEWTEGGIVNYHSTGSPFLTFTVGDVSFKMIFVEGGSYSMNYTNTKISDWKQDNEVTLTGTLSDYYIQQTECTNQLYKAVMGSTPSSSGATDDHYPVNNLTWNDVTTASTGFIDRLNELVADQLPPGMKFKLPSEAQWAYAAQGGNKRYYYGTEYYYEYPGAGNADYVAVYGTTKLWWVAWKGPNELGLYDMSGNVWELCQDNYNIQTSGDKGHDYIDTSSSSYRVVRGGCYNNPVQWVKLGARGFLQPTDIWGDVLGFRLALQ